MRPRRIVLYTDLGNSCSCFHFPSHHPVTVLLASPLPTGTWQGGFEPLFPFRLSYFWFDQATHSTTLTKARCPVVTVRVTVTSLDCRQFPGSAGWGGGWGGKRKERKKKRAPGVPAPVPGGFLFFLCDFLSRKGTTGIYTCNG